MRQMELRQETPESENIIAVMLSLPGGEGGSYGSLRFANMIGRWGEGYIV